MVDVYGIREDVDSVTINTDLTIEVSIDGGSTYASGSIVDVGTAREHTVCEVISIDVSGQIGTSLVWRLKTLNTKAVKIRDLFVRTYS